MKNLRTYGQPPFTIALLHGGPGAPGSMAPVARKLAANWGVLEPLQTATSLAGQIEELRTVLRDYGHLPITLIGSSWGAMLGFMVAARCPELIKKLILVGSGVYEERYAANIQAARLSRLTLAERREAHSLLAILKEPDRRDKSAALAQLGKLFTKADAYQPVTLETEILEVQYQIHQQVWSEAAELRKSGQLLALGQQIQCPVVAIHGDYDPHLAEGVEQPLSAVLTNFRFILLRNCGHLPWLEEEARDKFYEILTAELRPQQ
jgi:pimeloyl-ACP methyl ester carboxylesterase